jgi:hypothetical protein
MEPFTRASGSTTPPPFSASSLRNIISAKRSFGSLIWADGSADLPVLYAWAGDGADCRGHADNGGYPRASYASGGGGASRVPRIAGDVTVGPAHASCVRVSYAPCAERRRFDLLRRG